MSANKVIEKLNEALAEVENEIKATKESLDFHRNEGSDEDAIDAVCVYSRELAELKAAKAQIVLTISTLN